MMHANSQTWLFSPQVSCFCFQRRLSESNGYTSRCQKRASTNAVSIHISGILCDDLHRMLCLFLSAFWGTSNIVVNAILTLETALTAIWAFKISISVLCDAGCWSIL